jgi:hypothetical protein
MIAISSCAKQRVENGILHVDIDLDCVVKSMSQSVPIKSSKYTINGSILTIEVVPDMENILNRVMSK